MFYETYYFFIILHSMRISRKHKFSESIDLTREIFEFGMERVKVVAQRYEIYRDIFFIKI